MDRSLDIIAAMYAEVPSGVNRLDHASILRLQGWTRQLLAARSADARSEYARFLAIGQRELAVPDASLEAWISGKTVLVTGGTGCIGSALLALIEPWHPRRVVSVSRGLTKGWPRHPSVEYVRADIRDDAGLDTVIGDVRPDLIFHLAAQRDPGLAEREIHRTVSTNVLGTRNVLAAAGRHDAAQVVIASSGKALRPYSQEVYAASKRAAEWIAQEFAAQWRIRCSAARFTHVVNNSIILHRLVSAREPEFIRLYGTDIIQYGSQVAFYAQSALESAQLLLCAGLGAADGDFMVHAITDLDWPVSLLDLALGVIASTGSASAIYFSGDEPGYENEPFPGLYDPLTAGDVSPLISAFEADGATRLPHANVDAFALKFAASSQAWKELRALDRACAVTGQADVISTCLDDLSWSLLDATLEAMNGEALARVVSLMSPHENSMQGSNLQMVETIKRHAQGFSAVGREAIRAVPSG